MIISSDESPLIDKLSIDEALHWVGAKHRYQKITFIYFCFQWLITYWILGSPTYLFQSPTLKEEFQKNHQNVCKSTESFEDQKCNDLICLEYYDNVKDITDSSSVLLEYEPPLICHNDWIRTILEQQVYIGSFLGMNVYILQGFFLFSFISDNYGRKISLGLSWLVATIGAVVIGTANSYWQIGVGLCLCGFGANPSITVHYSFIQEQSQGKFREFQNIGIQTFFGIGEMILVPISYKYRHWRTLCLYWFSIPMILLNFPIFFVKESPKFMMHHNQKKTIDILNEIAAINNKPKLEYNQVQFQGHKVIQKKYWITDLIRYKSLRIDFLSGFANFIVIQYVFYGLNFSLTLLDSGFYVSAFVMGCFDTAAYLLIDFVIPYCPRKRGMYISFGLSALFCFIYYFVGRTDNETDMETASETKKIILLILLGLIRFFITSVWSFAYAYYSELFPSCIRSLALGMISVGGTFGSIASPLNRRLLIGGNPMILLGILSSIAVFITMASRETFKQNLLDEIEEEKVEVYNLKDN